MVLCGGGSEGTNLSLSDVISTGATGTIRVVGTLEHLEAAGIYRKVKLFTQGGGMSLTRPRRHCSISLPPSSPSLNAAFLV